MAATTAPTSVERCDAALLRAAYSGDESAFEELFVRHRSRVYGVARRVVGNHEEAEEVTLDVFLRLHQQRLSRLDDANVAGWLYRSATNTAFNVVRSRQRRRSWLSRLIAERGPEQSATDPAHEVVRDEQAAMVRHALARLPERQRNVLTLRAEGFSYREIAETLDVKVTSVGTTLARAEQSLRTAFEAQNGRS